MRIGFQKCLNAKKLAPRARFELATLRLTAERIENLSALSGVAYEKLGAIFPFLVAPNPAPTVLMIEADEVTGMAAQSRSERVCHRGTRKWNHDWKGNMNFEAQGLRAEIPPIRRSKLDRNVLLEG